MINKRAMYLLIVFTMLFVTLIGYITYIEIRYGEEYKSSEYNARNHLRDMEVVRGSVYDRNMNMLAYSEEKNDKMLRVYPYNNLYSHVIGYVSHDYTNRTLLEAKYNSELLGGKGLNNVINIGNQLKSEREKGNDLVLTIDHNLQSVANDAMGGYRGAIVAMVPQSGEILAMISKPDYNPNPDVLSQNYESLSDSTLYARAFQVKYPPGSTFKTVTTASIIENGMENETYDDKTGEFVIKSADGNPKNDFRCRNEDAKYAYGITDLTKAYIKSSNVYYTYLATLLSSKQLRSTAEDFMFNKKIDFDMPVTKSHFQEGDMTEAERAISAIGQGQTEATPLHMALIASTIANNGVMPEPYIVSSIRSGGIATYSASQKDIGRIIPEDMALQIKDMMLGVVEEGTGTNAGIQGIQVCGKTGTSENATTAKGGANSGKTHALFIGFAPYENPQIAVCVVMEEAGFGGNLAAKAARKVMESYLRNIGY